MTVGGTMSWASVLVEGSRLSNGQGGTEVTRLEAQRTFLFFFGDINWRLIGSRNTLVDI
jgi:hypothetical protein